MHLENIVLDAHDLPFGDGSLRAIVMTDVLHHLARPRDFLNCWRRNGRRVSSSVRTTSSPSRWH